MRNRWQAMRCVALLVLPALWISSAAFAGDAAVSDADYSVRADGKFATVSAKLAIFVKGEGWASLPLLPESVAMRSCDVAGARGYVQKDADHYTAQMLGEGNFSVSLNFILEVQSQGAERFIKLPLVRAASGRIRLDLDAPDCIVKLTPEVPMEPAHDAARTRATIVPGGAESLTIRWLPADLAGARAPIFEARETNSIAIQSGAVRRITRLLVTVQRGELDGLTLLVPADVDVLKLAGFVCDEKFSARPGIQLLQDWRIEEPTAGATERKVRVRFTKPFGPESLMIQVRSEQVFDAAAGVVSIRPLAVEGAMRQTGALTVAQHRLLTLVEAGSTGLSRDGQYARLPAVLRLKIEPIPARITAVTASRVKLQAGVVELTTQITHQIRNAPVDRLHIGLSEGLMALGVAGDDIETWEVKGGEIEVRLKRPVLGDHVMTVRCVENLKKVNGTLIPVLRCLDAERESGAIGITAGPDLALQHHHSEKVAQVDIARLPEWIREAAPKLGYVYDEPGGMLSVSTNLIRPVVRVAGYGIALVGEESLQEEYVFDCVIERQPLFGLMVDLPDDLTPLNLLGADVADWEFHTGQPAINVTFRQALTGKTQLRLFCERRRPVPTQAAEESQQLEGPRTLKVTPLGGVFIRDADTFSGWFAVATDQNLELKPLEMHGMATADIAQAPRILAAYGNLRLGFKWSGDDWGVTCDAVPIPPRIEATTRTALLFDMGVMRTLTDLTFHISKASVRDLEIVLPPKALNSAIVGKNIRSRERVGDTWHVRLEDAVKGDYALVVAYEQLPDAATGGIAYTGIRLPQAEREDAALGAYLQDPQLEVTAAKFDNASRAESSPAALGLPPEMSRFPFLGAFRHSGQERRIAFQVKGHSIAEGVMLHAENCTISSVVQEDGGAVSYMNCRARNTGAQFFKLSLPKDAALWGAYIEGKPVRPDRLSSGELLIPVLGAPRDGRPFDVGVIWSEPTKPLGVGSSLALASPALALPAQDVDWNLYLPRDYQLVAAGGNMKLLQRAAWNEEGLPGVVTQFIGGAWPTARTVGEYVLWILVVLVALYGLVRLGIYLHKQDLKRREAKAAEGKTPPTVGRTIVEVGVVLIILLILAGMLLPAHARAREESRKANSKENISQIGKAIIAYTMNYGEFMPPSLDALYPQYLDTPKVFRSPSSEDQPSFINGSLTESSYIYAGPIDPSSAKSDTPIAWERPGIHDGGGNVLFCDGNVRWITASSDLGRALGYANAGAGGRRAAAESDLGQIVKASTAHQKSSREAADIGLRRGLVSGRISGEQAAQAGTPIAGFDLYTQQLRPPVTQPQAPQAAAQMRADDESRQRFEVAKKLAFANERLGDLARAQKLLEEAVKYNPDSQDAKDQLQRIKSRNETLPQIAEAPAGKAEKSPFGGGIPSPAAPAPSKPSDTVGGAGGATIYMRPSPELWKEIQDREKFGLSAIRDYSARLPADMREAAAENDMQRDILSLAEGKKSRIALPSGGTIELRDGDLAIHGTKADVRNVEAEASALRGRMLAKAREIAASQRQQEAQLAAQKRAEFDRRLAASVAGAGRKGGTISGNRGAGAMPIEISFPSFGTRAYPFHMDYAGASQARIELKCLRDGAALVLQALAGLVLLAGLGAASWRNWRLGAALTLLAALALAAAWSAGGEASKQYVIAAMAGVVLSVPVIVASLAAKRREVRRTSNIQR